MLPSRAYERYPSLLDDLLPFEHEEFGRAEGGVMEPPIGEPVGVAVKIELDA